MEIPYIVTPRKDTGLTNSKIAIWLFLASEVMLFGGFFSAYVFLRLGADYPWPERTLPVLPGLINTFVLIGSSVTVVFAWVALKMREWRKFQMYMGITVACALIFMGLKAVEYSVKLSHQGVRLNDYTVIEGHLGYAKDGKEYALDHKGNKIEENRIRVETSALTFSTVRFHKPWVTDFLGQARHHGDAKITLTEEVKAVTIEGGEEVVIAKAGEPLTPELLSRIQRVHLDARTHNSGLRTAASRVEWKNALASNPGKQGWEISSEVNVDIESLKPRFLTEIPTVKFNVEPPTEFIFKPRDIREDAEQSRLRDDTVVDGKLLASPMVFHNVDAIDFQHLAMRAEERDIDPQVAIRNSWLMQNSEFAREAWAWHQKRVDALEARLIRDYGYEKDGKTPRRHPTDKERYRIGWKDLAEKAEEEGSVKLSFVDTTKEEFMGPNYAARTDKTFPHLEVPREQVRFASKFAPAWNTYYAIYFTITGLHGLHVIGGALVLAYYLFFGRKMYLENPEWLANRVEVGGLFWHFVDLVWIFVFPILYLM
jgi:heme/copper-type cytochrome/quinol oxidase subunit 3